ncbi:MULTISPECIES: response regulator [Sphingomonas]|jgi:DNA-binding response OmpR family regulator|uniref:Response regulator n=1 Tax=Sphingomonas ginsenosidimutans TaxID=862134 RepID=A0A2A4HYB2_9SPHN|nr:MULTISPECIES: response regulator [Sphingomonas]MBY0300342.1 response regulator [Sphingomonas ginsenosidimutans]MEE2916755.1 response regulator [Pseudomonadota bacterium]PCG08899.1 response regulator [Sphingomonas ginsenosidimutans]
MTMRVLLVEDEPLIAMMLEDFLEALDKGHAGTADCVAAALPMVAAGGIDAAILDVNLRSGEKSFPIADALAARGIPFVFATGGGGEEIAPEHRDRPRLSKPFTMDGVDQALAQLG